MAKTTQLHTLDISVAKGKEATEKGISFEIKKRIKLPNPPPIKTAAAKV
jgi:hypothetical protein